MADTLTSDDVIAEESAILLDRFTYDDAWALGVKIRDDALARNLPVAIEITHGTTSVFLSLMPGTTADNIDWLRRKRAVALRFQKSSLAMRLRADEGGFDLNARFGLPTSDYVAAGGAVPIRIRNVGVVGVAAVSGLPDVEDHAMVIRALRG